MKKSSEIQKIRKTKTCLSDEDWEEEITIQKRDLLLIQSGNLTIRQISLISQRAMKRLQLINDGIRYFHEKTIVPWKGL